MPSLGLDEAVDVLERLERRHLVVEESLCSRKRHRLSGCTRCSDVCHTGAIGWNEGLAIDWDACSGCGICATVCPTGALDAGAPSRDEILEQILRAIRYEDWVGFACPRSEEGRRAGGQRLMVSCLGRLDESLLVAAVAHGARSVWLVDGACGDCPQTIGWTVAHTVVARSNALLKAFGVREAITFRPSLPDVRAAGGNGQSNQGVSRRGMMKVLARETARVGEIRAETRQSSQLREEPAGKVRGELPHALPSRRVLLLAGLMRLGIPVARDLNGDGDGLFAQFTLGEGCTACQMCAFFCPTGALTKVEDGDRMGLCFSVAACTNCGLCRDICYRDAVLLSHQVDLNQVLALSVEWQFVQDAHTPPWKDPPDKKVGRQLLKSLGI